MTKQILVIDDDAAVRLTVETVLAGLGYQVVCARDGQEGIELFRSMRPDLVITDIIMPRREGIETVLTIRHEQPDARIIAMSGGGRMIGSDDALSLARKLGANQVISKPFDIDKLAAMIKQLIGA